jgi:hypothetical protein
VNSGGKAIGYVIVSLVGTLTSMFILRSLLNKSFGEEIWIVPSFLEVQILHTLIIDFNGPITEAL